MFSGYKEEREFTKHVVRSIIFYFPKGIKLSEPSLKKLVGYKAETTAT